MPSEVLASLLSLTFIVGILMVAFVVGFAFSGAAAVAVMILTDMAHPRN